MKRRGFVRSRGQIALAFPVYKEPGANVISVLEEVRNRLAEMNDEVLPAIAQSVARQNGLERVPVLRLEQVYDETIYINDALSLVQNNLVVGGVLAVVTLLVFLEWGRRRKLVLWSAPTLVALMVLTRLVPEGTPVLVVSLLLVGVLAVVLARARPTLIIALSIPICVIGTFVVMVGAGPEHQRDLAGGPRLRDGHGGGQRHRGAGEHRPAPDACSAPDGRPKSPVRAALDGAGEVWGAVLASTLTTLAVFLPVLTVAGEAGQLFRDIAIALSAAVALSLIVSHHRHPRPPPRAAAAADGPGGRDRERSPGTRGLLRPPHPRLLRHARRADAADRLGVAARAADPRRHHRRARSAARWLLMPPTDYLPRGNKNLVFGIVLTPPGYNVDTAERIGLAAESVIEPFWEAETAAETAEIPPPVNRLFGAPATGSPPVDNYFFVSFGSAVFNGATSKDKNSVGPLQGLLSAATTGPWGLGFAEQSSLFGRGAAGSRQIDVEVSATQLEEVNAAATALLGCRPRAVRLHGGAAGSRQLRPAEPGAAGGARPGEGGGAGHRRRDARPRRRRHGRRRDRRRVPALRRVDRPARPTARRGAGPRRAGRAGDGGGGSRRCRSPTAPTPARRVRSRWARSPASPARSLRRRSSGSRSGGPSCSRWSRRRRSRWARRRWRSRKRSRDSATPGAIAPTVEVRLAGSAGKLSEVRDAMIGTFGDGNSGVLGVLAGLLSSRLLLALLVTYLLMAALFESFLYPLVILFSVPLAAVGGFVGLGIVHHLDPTQQLDTLTMLGFVILIGVVVNNAILIVHQSLNFQRGAEGPPMAAREAIGESVRTRLRPILMTTCTSVAGMLPLVLTPGSGSELYRGLGAVIVGGLVCATLFTLVVVPLLLSLVMRRRRRTRSPSEPADRGPSWAAGATVRGSKRLAPPPRPPTSDERSATAAAIRTAVLPRPSAASPVPAATTPGPPDRPPPPPLRAGRAVGRRRRREAARPAATFAGRLETAAAGWPVATSYRVCSQRRARRLLEGSSGSEARVARGSTPRRGGGLQQRLDHHEEEVGPRRLGGAERAWSTEAQRSAASAWRPWA